MTEKVTLSKIDETWMKIDTSDSGIIYELAEHFKFEIPNLRFHPKVKAKIWDGIIRQVDVRRKRTYLGLATQMIEYCKSMEYDVELIGVNEKTDATPEEVHKFVQSLNIHSRNEPIEVRDYQLLAIYQCLKDKRHIIQSPTGSGKSVQIYTIIRYLLEQDKRILLVVPNISLVNQMLSDFKDYSSEVEWSADDNVHLIFSGQTKETKKNVICSTWQSLQTKSKIPDEWFQQFDCVIVDEVHGAKSTELTAILEKCSNAQYKFGFTGSLDKCITHKQQIYALFGDTTKVATTRDLIDKGQLSDIKIKTFLLKYAPETKKAMHKSVYKKEMDFLVAHSRRNKFISKLALATTGNTLILFQYVDTHGKILYDMIKELAPDREVHFIYGGVDGDDREEIRNLTESGENVIIVASVGTMAVGVNIRRLHNVIFASPTKSFIRVIQSIGRGLRVAKDKTHMKLFDVADDLRHAGRKNHTFNHYAERLKFYSEEQFPYTITEIEIEKHTSMS